MRSIPLVPSSQVRKLTSTVSTHIDPDTAHILTRKGEGPLFPEPQIWDKQRFVLISSAPRDAGVGGKGGSIR